MIRYSCVVVVLLGLMACGSNPVEDNFYSLVLAADDVTAPSADDESKAKLIVGPVQLPDYLNRRGIAMQTGANRVQTANHHFWAEPLEEAISKVLVRDIASLASGVTVDRDAGRWTEDGDCRLRIEFDKFHATDRSRVVSSGRYWLSSASGEVRQEFDLTETLYGDGYGQAVAALRQALQILAEQITDTIDSESLCSADSAQ